MIAVFLSPTAIIMFSIMYNTARLQQAHIYYVHYSNEQAP